MLRISQPKSASLRPAGSWIEQRRSPGFNLFYADLETDARAVQIMTIHHAKGLEASVVFLYGGFWPGPRGDVPGAAIRVPPGDAATACG